LRRVIEGPLEAADVEVHNLAHPAIVPFRGELTPSPVLGDDRDVSPS
jgi:hypothetical protein